MKTEGLTPKEKSKLMKEYQIIQVKFTKISLQGVKKMSTINYF